MEGIIIYRTIQPCKIVSTVREEDLQRPPEAMNFSDCRPCRTGRYMRERVLVNVSNITIIASSSLVCHECPSGFFSPDEASLDCEMCPIAHFASSSGSFKCEPCNAGRYGTEYGRPNCTKCGLGKFQNRLNATSCKLCPIGYYTRCLGSDECNKCKKRTTTLQRDQPSAL